MASGRQVEYRLNLNSNASSVLKRDSQAANQFDNSMWQVQKTLASFGVGLGAHFITNAAKDWTQGAADYEQAMIRIKNASQEGFGIFNEIFVNSQVDKFKLKLQETSDAYGSFLFKIKNANLSNEVSDRLFENLSVVGKVGSIPQEQMDAVIRNVGIMLGEGVLEARHLRGLSYSHPQLIPFLADALGLKDGKKTALSSLLHKEISDETMQQQLSQLISSGKLTKAGLNSNVLLDAIEKYRASVEGKLPETLESVQSHLNNLSNTLERFKNSMVLDEKPELVHFFKDLESGIHWLVEHEEGIISTGKTIFHIVEAYTAWRLALVALQTPFGIVSLFNTEQARANEVLNLYLPKKQEEIIINKELIESNISLSKSKEVLSSIENQETKIISEKTIALDLYTEAQISNIAATEKLKDEYIQLNLLSPSSFMGFGMYDNRGNSIINSEYIYGGYRTSSEGLSQVSIANENLAKTYGDLTIAEQAATVQASLFSKSEMDAAISIGKYNSEIELQNALLAENRIIQEQNALLALSKSGNKNILNPYSGAISSSTFTSGLMNVFIAGMAIEVANEIFPKGQVSKTEMNWKDWFLGASTLVTPSSWFNPSEQYNHRGFGKVKDIAEENRKANELQESLDRASSDLTKHLNPKNNDLFKIIQSSELFDKIDPKDKFGKRQESNEQVFDLLKKFGFDIPYVLDLIDSDIKKGTGLASNNKLKLPDEKKSIRGNSSNYFTVNIQQVNGMEKPVFNQVTSSTMDDVKDQVNMQMTRNLLQIINDIQISKTH